MRIEVPLVRIFLVDESTMARDALRAALQQRAEWLVVGELVSAIQGEFSGDTRSYDREGSEKIKVLQQMGTLRCDGYGEKFAVKSRARYGDARPAGNRLERVLAEGPRMQ